MALLLKSRSPWRLAMAACMLASLAQGQSQAPAWTSVPMVGLVTSQGNDEIRPMRGTPGSSVVGDALPLPAGADRIFLAPFQRWALIELSDGSLGYATLDGTQFGTVTPIAGALSSPGTVAFSPLGSSAALLSADGAVLQVLSNLNGSPQVATQFDASRLNVAAVAINEQGTLPVVITGSGDAYLMPSSGSPRFLIHSGDAAALSFLGSQSALALVSGSGGTATFMDGLNDQPYSRDVIATPKFSGVPLLQSSSDGKFLIIAIAGEKTAFSIDVSNRSVSVLDVPALVSRLDRLQGDTFLTSAEPGEAAWLLVAEGQKLLAGFAQMPPGTPNAPKRIRRR